MNDEMIVQMKIMNVLLLNIYTQICIGNSDTFNVISNDEFIKLVESVDNLCGDIFNGN